MTRHIRLYTLLAGAMLMFAVSSRHPGAQAALTINTTRVTIAGSSNIHEYTASTSTIRVTRAQVRGDVEGNLWAMPGGIDAFEVAIPAATLTSPREGIDKNMRKALKVQEHPDITFRLQRFEMTGAATARAAGTIQIAGVTHDVSFDLEARRLGATLSVKGQFPLLMTDYGVSPPKAMLGMLKTDPKVTVTFETVLGIPQT